MRSAFGVSLAASAVLGSMVLASTPASANGRYPNADMLIVDPGDAKHLVLRTTFGTLVSNDAGHAWSWICEEAVGYTGDPALTVLAGGDLLHGFLGNVVVSAQAGCAYDVVPFAADGRVIIDVTLDAQDATHAWVLASGFEGRRQASLIDATAGTAAPMLVAEDFVPSTVEVSRSRPQRLYVVGFDGNFQATLLASDDRGASWVPHPIGPYAALPMYLSAVDPRDPDTLYVRVDDLAADHLIMSRDGGASFSDVLTIPSDMLGFALSPDGTRVAAGGPGAGLYVADTSDMAFKPAAAIQSLRCLTWAQSGLFACAQESLDHWTVALSADQGQSFEPLWHVQDLVPLACEASTAAGAACPRAWLEIASRIGAELVPGEESSEPSTAPAASPKSSSCGLGPAGAQPNGALSSGVLSSGVLSSGVLSAALLLRRRRVRRKVASRGRHEALRGVDAPARG